MQTLRGLNDRIVEVLAGGSLPSLSQSLLETFSLVHHVLIYQPDGLSALLLQVFELSVCFLSVFLRVDFLLLVVDVRLDGHLGLALLVFVIGLCKRDLGWRYFYRGTLSRFLGHHSRVYLLLLFRFVTEFLDGLFVNSFERRGVQQVGQLLFVVLLSVNLHGGVVKLDSLGVQVHEVVDVLHGDVPMPFFYLHLQLENSSRKVFGQLLKLVLQRYRFDLCTVLAVAVLPLLLVRVLFNLSVV